MGCGAVKSSAAVAPAPGDAGANSKSTSSTSASCTVRDAGGADPKDGVMVLEKYRMSMSPEDIKGEGTSSICRKAQDIEAGTFVAVKVYKTKANAKQKDRDVMLTKFKRQIAVLKELQEPFVEPSDPAAWSDHIANAKPARLFVQLFDYTKDGSGEPGPDPRDKTLYVITELAQYSLKDYFAYLYDHQKLLSKGDVQNITRAIVLAVAGLHAKGFVHLDLKPENLMMFNGCLKIIDVDGCLQAGTAVSIQDSSVSFSPCYCAPEWARFLIEEAESKIAIMAALDVWSVGMTICELVTLDAVLKPQYASFLRHGSSHREAGFLFMDWLGNVKKAPIPKAVEKFDPQFSDLLTQWLLVYDPHKRRSLAQSLTHPYFGSRDSRDSTGSIKDKEKRARTTEKLAVDEHVEPAVRCRAVDATNKAPYYQGALYKLDAAGDPQNPVHWRKRDMWIAQNGSLCYWSIKDEKRLVLIEGAMLQGATIKPLKDSCRENAFTLMIQADEDDVNPGTEPMYRFACESKKEYDTWRTKLKKAVRVDNVNMTMRLGSKMKEDLDKFRVTVKNRRMVVCEETKDEFAPTFKAKLWKLKAEGDPMKETDWYEREMWVGKNGSLVYWSKKEERELVYYTPDDIQNATIVAIESKTSCKQFPFQVQRAASQEVEFAPGDFAANSEEERSAWIKELKKSQAG